MQTVSLFCDTNIRLLNVLGGYKQVMKEIVEKLTKLNQTISTMESCTGGLLANTITNIEGASEVYKFGVVPYSNEYKIKLGVDKQLIEKYTVYSQEVASNMAHTIANIANANYGIGITGKLNKPDKNNQFDKDNVVYISIYNSSQKKYYNKKIYLDNDTRENSKKYVVDQVIQQLKQII